MHHYSSIRMSIGLYVSVFLEQYSLTQHLDDGQNRFHFVTFSEIIASGPTCLLPSLAPFRPYPKAGVVIDAPFSIKGDKGDAKFHSEK